MPCSSSLRSSAAACSSSTTTQPAPAPSKPSHDIAVGAAASQQPVALTGFRGSEQFCSPRFGTLNYVTESPQAFSVRFHLHHLRTSAQLRVVWRDEHSPRRYQIATFSTDSAGRSQSGGIITARNAAARGSLVEISAGHGMIVGTLRPC